MKPPRVIFVDWHGTLSNSNFWSQWAAPQHPQHGVYKRIEAFLFKENPALVDDWMRGKITTPNVLEKISTVVGVGANELWSALQLSCAAACLADERMRELIMELRRQGIRVVLATDNMDIFRSTMAKAACLEELFDEMIISAERGALKKDFVAGALPFFDAYMKRNSMTYDQAVLVDNSPDRAGVLMKAGMRLIKVASTQQAYEAMAENFSATPVC